jgi:hypothetical protein
MSTPQKIFRWLTPELTIHMIGLIATASAAFCVLKARADVSDLELAALQVRVSAVESEANETNLLVAQEKVRLDNQERMLEQTRLTTESIRAVLADVSGDLKAMKALLQGHDFPSSGVPPEGK